MAAHPGTIRVPVAVEVETTVRDTFASDQAHVVEISRLNPDELAGYLSTQTVEEVERFLQLTRDVEAEHVYRGQQALRTAARVRERLREITGDEPGKPVALANDGRRSASTENTAAPTPDYKPEPVGIQGIMAHHGHPVTPRITGNGLIPTELHMAKAAQEALDAERAARNEYTGPR